MASSVLVDCSFLVALLNERDANHAWAAAEATRHPPIWRTCEAVLSETFHLLGATGMPALVELLTARAVTCDFKAADHIHDILKVMTKYADVPMAFADACLVRMSEVMPNPTILTTDKDFRIYRRHGRQAVPCILPL
jgi:predicted nucleic acid-binding protein